MKKRLIEAISCTEMRDFFNREAMLPFLLKGGYEDIFSMMLFSIGFTNNRDLVPQYSLSGNGQIDLAKLTNSEIKTMLEFGHQFSLQFGENSSFIKLLSEVKKRTKNEDLNAADLFTIQLITDVKEVSQEILDTSWGNKFTNRYGVNRSLNNPKEGINRINSNINVINNSCVAKGVNSNTSRLIISVAKAQVAIDVHVIISGPFNIEDRNALLV